MKTPLFGSSSATLLTTGSVEYLILDGGSAADTTEANAYVPIPTNGVLSTLYVKADAAPAAGKSYEYRLMVDGVQAALTTTINDAETTDNDLVNTVSVTAGQLVSMRTTPSGTPTAHRPKFGLVFTGSTEGEAIIIGTTMTNVIAAGQTLFAGPNGGGTFDATEINASQRCPVAGTMKKLYVKSPTAPGVGETFTITLSVNGTPSALTCQISGTGTTANDISHNVTIAADDDISIKVVASAGAASSQIAFGMVLAPTTNGESPKMYNTTATPPTGSTNYDKLSRSGGNAWTVTEANRQSLVPIAFTSKKFYARITTAPGAAKSWDFSVRDSGASAVTLNITGAAQTTQNDTATTYDFAISDLINWRATPTGTPTSAGVTKFGFATYIVPQVSATYIGKMPLMGVG